MDFFSFFSKKVIFTIKIAEKGPFYAIFQNFKDEFFRYLLVAVILRSGNAILLVATLKHFDFGARPGRWRGALP